MYKFVNYDTITMRNEEYQLDPIYVLSNLIPNFQEFDWTCSSFKLDQCFMIQSIFLLVKNWNGLKFIIFGLMWPTLIAHSSWTLRKVTHVLMLSNFFRHWMPMISYPDIECRRYQIPDFLSYIECLFSKKSIYTNWHFFAEMKLIPILWGACL